VACIKIFFDDFDFIGSVCDHQGFVAGCDTEFFGLGIAFPECHNGSVGGL
jgi:hypothetical protein